MKFLIRVNIACGVDFLRNVGAKSVASALNDFNKSLR